jgi:hypothetical protein
LKEHLLHYGLGEKEIARMFYDSDIGMSSELRLQDFQIFYRDIWNTPVNFKLDTQCKQIKRVEKNNTKKETRAAADDDDFNSF